MSVKERIKIYIKNSGSTILAFEKSINASNGYVNSISKGIGGKYLEKIREIYPDLNINWLLTGEWDELNPRKGLGELSIDVLKSKEYPENKIKLDQVSEAIEEYDKKKQIPFYDVDFYSGFQSVFSSEVLPTFFFYHPDFERAEFAVKNSGQSMGTVLRDKDIIGMKEVKDWHIYFPQGEIYGVVTTNDMRTVKVVRENDDKTKFMLIPKPTDLYKSDYPEYEEIPKEHVLKLFQVVASMSSNKLSM